MATRKEIGRAGEDAVCRYLTKRGFTILCRNFTTDHGEIDVIAADERYLVFCEVKTRKDLPQPSKYGRPARAVDLSKRAHLLYAAKKYISKTYQSDRPGELFPRMDVAEVLYREEAGEMRFRVRYIERAFGAQNRVCPDEGEPI